MSEKGQNFLQRFMQKHTPFRSLADSALLGATDYDKKGRNEDQTSGLSAGLRRGIAGTADALTLNNFDFDQRGSNAQVRAREINEFDKELAKGRETLGSPFNEDKFYRNLRGMQVTDSLMRDYEMGREKQRNLDMMRQTLPMVDLYAETAAQRRLMEDKSSPTKISQQILRARTGEAALMDAVARQGNTAVNIATAGLSPRGRAGGR